MQSASGGRVADYSKSPAIPPVDVRCRLEDYGAGTLIPTNMMKKAPVTDWQRVIAMVATEEFRPTHDGDQFLTQMIDGPMGFVRPDAPGVLQHVAGPLVRVRHRRHGVLERRPQLGATRLTDPGAVALGAARQQAGGAFQLRAWLMSCRGPLGDSAGVGVLGLHSVTSLAIRSTRLGPPLEGSPIKADQMDGPLPMLELYPTGADVLFEANGLPLVTRRQVGDGLIFVIAVPAEALRGRSVDLDGAERFEGGPHIIWKTICDSRASQAVTDPIVFNNPLRVRGADNVPRVRSADQSSAPLELLSEIAGRRAPGRQTPIIILIALAAFVAVLGALLRMRRRGELLWVALLPIGLIIGCSVYYVASRDIGESRVTYIGLISKSDGGSRSQQYVLYTGGKSTEVLSVTAGSPSGQIEPLGQSSGGVLGGREIRFENGELGVPDVEVALGGTQGYYIDAETTGPTIAGTITFNAEGAVAQIRNDLPFSVDNSILYANGATYRLGTLEPGRAHSLPVRRGELLARHEYISTMVKGVDDERKERLVESMLTHVMKRPTNAYTAPALIGYTGESLLTPVPEGGDYRGWSVVMWPLHVQLPPVGTRVMLPAGFVDFEAVHLQWSRTTDSFNAMSLPLHRTIRCRPMVGAGRLRGVKLIVHINMQAPDYVLRIYAGKKTRGAPNPVATVEDPQGELAAIEVPFPDSSPDPAKEFEVTVSVERKESSATGGVDDSIAWQFYSFRVSLEGEIAGDGQ